MRSEITGSKIDKKEKALTSFFFNFSATTYLAHLQSRTSQNFAKEPNLAHAPLTSILVMTNWNNYDR